MKYLILFLLLVGCYSSPWNADYYRGFRQGIAQGHHEIRSKWTYERECRELCHHLSLRFWLAVGTNSCICSEAYENRLVRFGPDLEPICTRWRR